jgi:hypothetical protein
MGSFRELDEGRLLGDEDFWLGIAMAFQWAGWALLMDVQLQRNCGNKKS